MEKQPSNRAEHLTESSSEYQEFLRATKENQKEPYIKLASLPFGAYELLQIEQSRAAIARVKDSAYIQSENEEIEDCFKSIRAKLLMKSNSDVPYVRAGFKHFFRVAGEDGELGDASELQTKFSSGSTTNSQFEQMVRKYVEKFNAKERILKEISSVILEKFKLRAVEAIKNGSLPISEELLNDRLKNLEIKLVDAMSVPFLGQASQQYGIQISSEFNNEELEHMLFHELVHILDGTTIIKANKSSEIRYDINHQKAGLLFIDYKNNRAIFEWLYEAVTEEIGSELAGDKPTHYPRERAMLQDLYKKGLSKEILYAAYFENYGGKTKPGSGETPIPQWKNLVKNLEPLGGIELLKKMDKEYRERDKKL